MWWKLTHKTRTTYSTFRKNFVLHCCLWGIFSFPIKSKVLILWIIELNDFLTSAIIKTYLLNVRSIQIDLEFRDLEVFHHPWLKRIITGIKKQKRAKKRRKRWPITKNVLLKLFNHFDQNIQKNLTWHAFCCLVFTAFLRIGEFIYLKQNLKNSVFEMWHFIRQSVILQKNKLTLFLFTSKTDFFKKNVTLFITAAGDKACVMASLKHLFTNFFTSPNFFLFQTSAGFPFIHDIFVDKIKKNLLQHNYQNSYSKHAFKKNVTISAKTMKLSNDEIQLLRRWKSDVYHLYINLDPEAIIRAFRRHQQEIHNRIPHAASTWTTRQAPPFGLKMGIQGNIALKNRCQCLFQKTKTTKMLSWFVKILFKQIMQKFY